MDGSELDLFRPSTRTTHHRPISGPHITNALLQYLSKRTWETYNNILVHLSPPIPSKPAATKAGVGIGRIKTERLVPKCFREKEERFIPDATGWKSVFVIHPAYMLIHHNHWLAGQIMAHIFGHKVHFQSHFQKKN